MRRGNFLTSAALRLGIVEKRSEPLPVASWSPVETGTIFPARSAVSREPRSIDAVYRALAILETSARQLTLDVWRDGETIPAPSIIARPNLDMQRGAFIAQTVSSMAQRGNAYWRLHRNASHEIMNIEILDPREMLVSADKNSRPVYSYKTHTIPRADLIHLRLTHVPGELVGYSPLEQCMATINGALDMRAYADNWTNQAGRPTGILSTEQTLTQEQAEAYKQRANAMFTPSEGVAVLGGGLRYSKILLTPEELQFLDSQKANVVSIARMFGIPARHMLATVEGGAQTYANLEQEEITFIRYTLMAYLREIEEAFDTLTPRGQTVRFNLEGLLRTDTKTRYEAHAIALNSGFLTIDEVRAIEGLPPLEQHDSAKENNENTNANS